MPSSRHDVVMKENTSPLKGASMNTSILTVSPVPQVDPSDLFLPPTQPIDITELISRERP